MKKVLVGVIVTSLLLVFQIATVHGNSFSYKERIEAMLSSVEDFFKSPNEKQERLEEDLAQLQKEVSATTTNHLEQYKRKYLSNLAEKEESMQLHDPFTEYTKQKNNEIESEIREDITSYISELLEQDNKQLKNRKGE
jgi:cell shape-determining protein MreC